MIQPFSQKYSLVQFIEPVNEGYEYSCLDWPLHSTIIDVFAIDWSVERMSTELAKALAQQAIIHTTAREDAFFGENGEVRVTLLERTDALVELHTICMNSLQPGGLALNNPHFSHEGYLPHVTVQKHGRIDTGDIVEFNALSLVDMFPDGDAYQRKVLRTIAIGSNNDTQLQQNTDDLITIVLPTINS